jgi:ATP-binding cassette, subfamily B, bacterial PglK
MDALKRLLRLLVPAEKAQLRRVLALAVLAGLLEMIAVLSVLPFMAAVASPSAMMAHPVAEWAGATFGLTESRDLLLVSGLGVLLLVLVANAAGVLRLRMVLLSTHNIKHFLSRRLLSAYLARPYSWFLEQHSSGPARVVLDESDRVIQGVLLALLGAAIRGVAAVLIVLLLLVVDFRLTLVVAAVMGGAYVVIYLGVRRIQERLGEMRVEATQTRFKVATEVLGGIKEVKSLGVEQEFLRRFDATGPPFVRATAWSQVLAETPRHLLEVLSVGTVLAILLYQLSSGQSLEDSLPTLSVFAFAGYKLVPAFHQVFTGITVARFNLASLKAIEDDLVGIQPVEAAPPEDHSPLPLAIDLELREVTFSYPKTDAPALAGINLKILRGERIGIVGPTGSGKTTLVDVLLGLLEPESGEILVDGVLLNGPEWPRWRASVGYVPQSIFLADETIEGNIAFGLPPGKADSGRVREAARMAELDEFVGELADGYSTEVGERGVRLSGGQRQRIGIARSLYRDPSLLLLDEATSALDVATEKAVIDSVYGLEGERTMIIIAHRLSTLRRCDRIILLERGRVSAQGTWDELLTSSDLFRVLARLDGPLSRSEYRA